MILFLIFIILNTSSEVFAETITSEPVIIPSLIESVKTNEPLNFCGESMPINTQSVKENWEKELLIILWDRAQVILWLKRAGRYFPYIEKVLKENQLPEDLKYVAIVESSLRPIAYSNKGASGFWQFIASTGKRYGLRIDSDIDERRNIFPSTRAALNYLKDIHRMFGSWTLSAAGYNMGEAGLSNEIKIQKTNNFYYLYLPSETMRYIFRILAVKQIIKNQKKFGFDLKSDDIYSPINFDKVELTSPLPIPVQLIAEASNTYYKFIKELNPEIIGRNIPKGYMSIAIPKGTSQIFYGRYNEIQRQIQLNNQSNSKKH